MNIAIISRPEPQRAANYGIKEDIREYWTRRAETFDISPFHGMRAPGEREAWQKLIARHAGGRTGADVLELAFGTGEVTSVLLDLDYRVTGLDLTEAMLRKAKAKHAGRKGLSLFLGDAESTREPDSVYDAVIMRHLVWTLVDPAQAFADWFRVLRPGGRVVIIDGNFAEKTLLKRLRRRLCLWLERFDRFERPVIDWPAHNAIMEQVYFSDGLTIHRLKPMLEAAGFTDFRVEGLDSVRAIQKRGASLADRFRLGMSNSFVLSCAKPR